MMGESYHLSNENKDDDLSSKMNNHEHYDPISSTDYVTFDSPSLGEISNNEKFRNVLLAWIMLTYRGSFTDEELDISWSRTNVADQDKSLETLSTYTLSTFIKDHDQPISDCYKSLRLLSEEIAAFDSKIDSNRFHLMSLKRSKEQNKQELVFCIEITLAGRQLQIRPILSSTDISSKMTKVYTRVYVDILESIFENPNQQVTELMQPTHSEISQIWCWNDKLPQKIDRCMHELFMEKAQEFPNQLAVQSWDGQLTYGELDQLSTQLALHLKQQGVGQPQAIPLCFAKSMWTIVAVLAVMKIGRAFVLMDPGQPEVRLQTIVKEVNAEIILTSQEHAELGSRIAPDARTISVGPDLLTIIQNISVSTLSPVPSDSTMYIIFTSGSTGKPKGVIITHSNYTSGALPRAQAVGYNENINVLDFASYAFDVSIDCMLCTLATGGCICVPSDEARVNNLSGVIRDMKVNMVHTTPSVARILESDIVPSLKVLGLGGEAVSVQDVSKWNMSTNIIIAYGPSECTVGCTINNDIPIDRTYTSLGKGVGCCLWIVDPTNHDILTPIGNVGELLVEGPIVGEGYINEPEKTNTVFIKDPSWLTNGEMSKRHHGRLYKTGDLVRYDPDGSGSIVFIGRKDHQVKIRGQRVELGEVEHHVRSKLPKGISITAEVITPENKLGPTLVAFIAENYQQNQEIGNKPQFSPELRKVLKDIDKVLTRQIPKYMVPSSYIPLKEMPIMVSGKTDRKQLRSIGSTLSRRELLNLKSQLIEKQDPETEMEKLLSQLWTSLLGDGPGFGLNDNFFSLGGDSLKAMKLVSAAREVGISLTVGDIFSNPTLSDMASAAKSVQLETISDIPAFSLLEKGIVVESVRAQVAAICDVPIDQIEDIYPCTPLQEGLMALSSKVQQAYIAQRVLQVKSSELYKLQEAFNIAIHDCPILRTRIIQLPGHGLMQSVLKEHESWYFGSNLEDYLNEDSDKAMRLGSPLIRLACIKENNSGKGHVVLTMHHALYDGWSMPLVVDRVNKAHEGRMTKRIATFKHFMKFLNSVDRTSSEKYWRNQLEGLSLRQFPSVPKPGYQPHADSLLERHISPNKISQLNTTLANIIRVGWAIVAAKYSGSNDVVVGETLTGRNAPIRGVEDIEGPMITTVPVRIKFSPRMTVSQLLNVIHKQNIEQIPHEHFGLQHIRRLSADAREACELKTGLVLHPHDEEEGFQTRASGIADGLVPVGDAEAALEAIKFNSYPLMLVCTLDSSGFLVMASFDSNVISAAEMEQVLEHFEVIVRQICEAEDKPISEIDFLNDKEKAKLWHFSDIGPQSLVDIFPEAKGTWILDPIDNGHLSPTGATGELIVEDHSATSCNPLDKRHWLHQAVDKRRSYNTHLIRTGRLARYTQDGHIVLEHIDTTRDLRSKSEQVIKESSLPRTSKELALLNLWSRILHVDQGDVSPNDNFFDLGGDSISAMKLVSEIRSEGYVLNVSQIFQNKILMDMANIMSDMDENKNVGQDYKPFSLLDISDPEIFVKETIKPMLSNPDWKILDVVPARPLQDIAVTGTVNLPRYSARYELFYLDTAFDIARLRLACRELVKRNEILRTVFVRSHDTYGVVLENIDVPVVEFAIDQDLEKFSKRLCELDILTRMPLGSSFIKFMLVRERSGRCCFIFRISHAQYDEICLPLMLSQLSKLYEGRQVDKFVPFSSFVNHTIRKNLPESISYWRNLLEGSEMTRLRPCENIISRKHFAISKSFDISKRPQQFTMATFPTAAWAICLAHHLSKSDVVFGEVVSGRNTDFPSSDKVIGPCWQYVPVRIQFKPGWTFTDLLTAVQEQHISSSRYEGIGFNEIVKNCTEWGSDVEWFDTVIHQDVDHVEQLSFLSSNSSMETIYPHFEPLREWKIQAYPKKNELTLEIITFESWSKHAESLITVLEEIFTRLLSDANSRIFQ